MSTLRQRTEVISARFHANTEEFNEQKITEHRLDDDGVDAGCGSMLVIGFRRDGYHGCCGD